MQWTGHGILILIVNINSKCADNIFNIYLNRIYLKEIYNIVKNKKKI